MPQSRKVRWAIFGTSFISHTLADAFSASDTSELIAIASHTQKPETALFAKQYNIPTIYSSFDEALADPRIDAVYLGLPNHTHIEWSEKAAKAGKHFLIEKPWASTAAEVKQSQTTARENNVIGMEALMYQCHPFIEQLIALVNTRLGNINFMTASYSANIYALENPTQGGAIRNLGCYPLSLVRLLAKSEPLKLIGSGTIDQEQKRDTTAHAILIFNNGITASITTSNIHAMFSQFAIYGTNGGVIQLKTNPWLPTHSNEVILSMPDQADELMTLTADKPLFTYEIDYLAKHIQSGHMTLERPGVTSEHSLGNAALIDDWLRQVAMF